MTVLLIGCGRMGGALARGWRSSESVHVYDPAAPDLEDVQRLDSLEEAAALPQPLTIVIAVKPQILADVLPPLRPLAAAGSLFISVVAGASVSSIGRALGNGAPIVRTMPNTPAAVGRGITAAAASEAVTEDQRDRVTSLLSVAGEVLWVDEAQMDAVTAVSGSGPAYFFRFTEALAKAGVEQGLPPDVAMRLARATFTGSAALAEGRSESLIALREEVTSPGGTTAAALARFDEAGALDDLVREVAAAAAARSRQLAS